MSNHTPGRKRPGKHERQEAIAVLARRKAIDKIRAMSPDAGLFYANLGSNPKAAATREKSRDSVTSGLIRGTISIKADGKYKRIQRKPVETGADAVKRAQEAHDRNVRLGKFRRHQKP